MVISIFGIILLLIIFTILLLNISFLWKYTYIWTTCIVIELFVNTGYFLKYNETIIKSADFIQLVLLILSLFLICEMRIINIKSGLMMMLIFLVLLGNLIFLKYFPFNGVVRTFDSLDRTSVDWYRTPKLSFQSLKSALRILVFIYNSLVFKTVITKEKWEIVKKIIIIIGATYVLFCWIELILKNIFIVNTKPYIDHFFGLLIQSDMMLIRNNLYTVHGLTSEPSQLAMTLFYFCFFFVIGMRKLVKTSYTFLFFSSVIIMYFSGSFRFVGLFPWLLLAYMLKNKLNIIGIFKYTLFFGSVFFIAIYFNALDYLLFRLDTLFRSISTGTIIQNSSEAARMNTVIEAFNIFSKRPLLGVGLGVTFSYGFVPSMLSSVGLIGILCWYYIIFKHIASVRLFSKQFIYVLILTVTWLYTSAIDVAYFSPVLAIAFEFYFQNRIQLKNRSNGYKQIELPQKNMVHNQS